ncbi:MAG: transposase [Xanthobacteraceae bacterium]|jgi:REP element-mobilizing transposase RayT
MDRDPHTYPWQARGSADKAAKHRRRSLRLKGYDYAQAGAYFITICTQGRACLFGDVVDGSMCWNAAGQLAATTWNDTSVRFPGIELDAFVVMPNHLHGIIVLPDRTIVRPDGHHRVGAPLVGAHDARAAPTVGDIVRTFKSLFTVAYIQGVKENRRPGFDRRLWQRNYYEHIIRDEPELARVRRYIDENPLRWAFDHENPLRS